MAAGKTSPKEVGTVATFSYLMVSFALGRWGIWKTTEPRIRSNVSAPYQVYTGCVYTCQEVKGHGGNLRDMSVPITFRHSRHNHELVFHSVHIVNLGSFPWSAIP